MSNHRSLALQFGHDERTVLALLVAGMTQPTVARRMHVGLRVIEGRVARIRSVLGATGPYTLGALAVRHGYAESDELCLRARNLRQSSGVRPTMRQLAILHRLSLGESYPEAAAQLGVAPRTLRRDFKKLCSAAGVTAFATAGALFEACGWHPTRASGAQSGQRHAAGS